MESMVAIGIGISGTGLLVVLLVLVVVRVVLWIDPVKRVRFYYRRIRRGFWWAVFDLLFGFD